MTIYVSGRQSGKTTFLIRQSADTGAVIVAPTCQMARYIDSMARDLGLQIPPPVTVADWIRGLVRQPKDHDKTYLVDELQMALHQLNVKAATIDRNYEEMVRMFGVKETCCTRCSHNMMLDYALEYELVDRNYSRTFNLTEETVKEIQKVKKGHIAFTDDEMELLWNNIDEKHGIDILLIQCYSGWRPQELGLLELKDVDLESWTFQGGMKTDAGENRVVPIHSRIQDLVLKKYREAEAIGSPYLLNWADPNNRNKKNFELTYARYQKAFERIRDELKLNPEHRPHDGRTHFVTMAKRYGVDEYAIKYMVGHKISDITEKVYTRREFTWLREEIEKIK